MNAIVFQEMREKRSLAYSASSHYTYGSDKDGYFYNSANVITQNDKLLDALNAYEELFDDMPQAEANFKLAKDALLAGEGLQVTAVLAHHCLNGVAQELHVHLDVQLAVVGKAADGCK
jgi:hypothetical protein